MGLWVRVDRRAMAMKEYSTFPKAPRLQPHHQMQFCVISRTLVVERSYPFVEMQLVYSTASADWDVMINVTCIDDYNCHVTTSFITVVFIWFCHLHLLMVITVICPWSNGYRHRKWTRRHEFKSWTRLIAFHIALIPLGKVWIQLFSLQLWVNSRTD